MLVYQMMARGKSAYCAFRHSQYCNPVIHHRELKTTPDAKVP
jgi:hypothetical protein